MQTHLAILDDDQRMAEILAMLLRREGYAIETFYAPTDFFTRWPTTPFDLVLTDLKMPEMDGVTVLKKLKEHPLGAGIPVILMTAHGTIRTAIDAMRLGAFDYIEKPFDNEACKKLIKNALHTTRLERENRLLRAALRQRYALDHLVAVSPAMNKVLEIARRAAQSRATCLITGESGTGKELIARTIHAYSDRVGGPFVAVNCKAFADGVLEAELFGHEKGAFTGAWQERAGLFEQAHQGTLFLDEIGETDSNFQAKLLRVLQEREVQRVGSHTPRAIDVRILAATNRDLQQEIDAKRFREDLFFRLAVIPLHLPPLRERKEDILPLARQFLLKWSAEMGRPLRGWSAEVEAYLLRHTWPGNIRELENMMERAVVLAREDQLEYNDLMPLTSHLPPTAAVPPSSAPLVLSTSPPMTLHEHLDWAAAHHIQHALTLCQGIRIDAAKQLGIERTTLYRLIKKFGLDPQSTEKAKE